MSTAVTCRECGAPARSLASAAASTAAAEPLNIDVTVEEPEAETIRAPKPEEDAQEEPVTTRTPGVLRDVTDTAEDDEKTITRQPDLDSGETPEIPPVSGTPSIDALIAARARREPKEEAPKSRSVLEAPRYDLRPPDIQVESSSRSRLRTDAPVTGTNRPPASTSKSSNRVELLVALALFSAAGAFFTLRSLREDASETPSSASGLVPTEATHLDPAAQPIPELAPQAEPSPATAEAPPPVPAAVEAEEQVVISKPSRRKEPAVVPASLKVEEAAAPLEPAPPPLEAFDADAANQALAITTTQASTCRKSSDPSGVATVTITFSPSGRVTQAQISGPPFAGTETGSCIASELRKARVPAFSGEFMTVRKTVVIQ